jgi:alkylhydroperoxidase family enzyme
VLRSKFFSAEQLEAIVQDYRQAGLEPAEVAMMAYAEKIILNAYKVTPEDIDGLRAHGFSDTDILDIALTAAARSFYSKVLDAVGAEPDEQYLELQPELRRALSVGRPFGS